MPVSSRARAHALKADNARRATDGREDGNVGVGVLEPATPAAAATSVFLSVVDGRAAGRRSHLQKRHRVLLAPLYSVEVLLTPDCDECLSTGKWMK